MDGLFFAHSTDTKTTQQKAHLNASFDIPELVKAYSMDIVTYDNKNNAELIYNRQFLWSAQVRAQYDERRYAEKTDFEKQLLDAGNAVEINKLSGDSFIEVMQNNGIDIDTTMPHLYFTKEIQHDFRAKNLCFELCGYNIQALPDAFCYSKKYNKFLIIDFKNSTYRNSKGEINKHEKRNHIQAVCEKKWFLANLDNITEYVPDLKLLTDELKIGKYDLLPVVFYGNDSHADVVCYQKECGYVKAVQDALNRFKADIETGKFTLRTVDYFFQNQELPQDIFKSLEEGDFNEVINKFIQASEDLKLANDALAQAKKDYDKYATQISNYYNSRKIYANVKTENIMPDGMKVSVSISKTSVETPLEQVENAKKAIWSNQKIEEEVKKIKEELLQDKETKKQEYEEIKQKALNGQLEDKILKKRVVKVLVD